jgi:hypothetical protein
VTIVLLALWVIGLAAYFDDRMFLSGAAFALATAFKVSPVLVVPLFLIWKDKRWLASYTVISFGLLLTMISYNGIHTVSLYPLVISAMSAGLPTPSNEGLSSLIGWVYYGKPLDMHSAQIALAGMDKGLAVVAKLACLAFYLVSLFLVWRNRKLGRTSRVATIAVFSLVIACVLPVSWRHGYAPAFAALAIFWVRTLRRPGRMLHVVLLSLTTFTLGTLIPDRVATVAALPQFCKMLLAASWVVFSTLFSLDALSHGRSDSQTDSDVDDTSSEFSQSTVS